MERKNFIWVSLSNPFGSIRREAWEPTAFHRLMDNWKVSRSVMSSRWSKYYQTISHDNKTAGWGWQFLCWKTRRPLRPPRLHEVLPLLQWRLPSSATMSRRPLLQPKAFVLRLPSKCSRMFCPAYNNFTIHFATHYTLIDNILSDNKHHYHDNKHYHDNDQNGESGNWGPKLLLK